MNKLLIGLVTGMLFGFFLQKGHVLRYDRQIGLLRLRDMTVLKFMLTAVMVGMLGIYLLVDLGLASLNPKSFNLGANVIGGLVFGIGWGLLGYCPGTAVGALGEGRWDALFGIMGIIVGGMLYAEAYPILKSTILSWADFGKSTLADLIGIHHWVLIPILCLGFLGLFAWFEKKGL